MSEKYVRSATRREEVHTFKPGDSCTVPSRQSRRLRLEVDEPFRPRRLYFATPGPEEKLVRALDVLGVYHGAVAVLFGVEEAPIPISFLLDEWKVSPLPFPVMKVMGEVLMVALFNPTHRDIEVTWGAWGGVVR